MPPAQGNAFFSPTISTTPRRPAPLWGISSLLPRAMPTFFLLCYSKQPVLKLVEWCPVCPQVLTLIRDPTRVISSLNPLSDEEDWAPAGPACHVINVGPEWYRWTNATLPHRAGLSPQPGRDKLLKPKAVRHLHAEPINRHCLLFMGHFCCENSASLRHPGGN